MEIDAEPLFWAADAESRQVQHHDSPLQSIVEGLDPASQAGSPLNTPAGITASLWRHYSCWPPALQQQQQKVRTWQPPLLKQRPSKGLRRSKKKRGASLAADFPSKWYWESHFPPSICSELYLICLLSQKFLLQPCFLFSSPEWVWRVVCLLVVMKNNITAGSPKVEPCQFWSLLQRLTCLSCPQKSEVFLGVLALLLTITPKMLSPWSFLRHNSWPDKQPWSLTSVLEIQMLHTHSQILPRDFQMHQSHTPWLL